MDTVQRRLSYTHSVVDQLRLRHAYRLLRDLRIPRAKLLMQLLADQGPLHVTDIEIQLYRAGDHTVTQAMASQTISTLRMHRVIKRHPSPPGVDAKHHYYALDHDRIRQIQQALDRFLRPLPW